MLSIPVKAQKDVWAIDLCTVAEEQGLHSRMSVAFRWIVSMPQPSCQRRVSMRCTNST